ncbi:MerR family transcriptional regulator [Labedaea rhizosphaerae]|uniref:DNA-binding transcriptional MerR regulator n=1 Tax=Labedaea rhizosphaerae TaxID=598644 RepID=A0A4R6SE54_LABRH|nr:MerR family transcriptional regulator [Labedaea rhizosphaerae]TDP97405.1 DNA-binding transcriptional MerR regulator [Labedaea rhizosphaerae]
MTRTWRTGQLAEASGLTVRTLRHWDAIGLLSPSRRTDAGHREYGEPDLVRLYQVLALRGLGLSLDTIAVCLDVGVDPNRLVRDQLDSVEQSLAGLEVLRDRLRRLADDLAADREPTTDSLLDALRAIGGNDLGVLRRHLDADQVKVLEARHAAMGPSAHYLLEIEWPELYRRAERLRLDGVDAGDPRVRALVHRMDELSTLFTGGDTAVSEGVRAAWRDDPAALSGEEVDAPAFRELADYLDRARTEGATR